MTDNKELRRRFNLQVRAIPFFSCVSIRAYGHAVALERLGRLPFDKKEFRMTQIKHPPITVTYLCGAERKSEVYRVFVRGKQVETLVTFKGYHNRTNGGISSYIGVTSSMVYGVKDLKKYKFDLHLPLHLLARRILKSLPE